VIFDEWEGELKKNRRTSIFYVSKYQRIFFYPVILAFLLGCIVSWLSLTYFFIGQFLSYPDLIQFQKIIVYLLMIATGLMIVVVLWTLRISNRYSGSYERIIKELDKMIEEENVCTLETRKGDIIFDELLRRINLLSKKL